MSVWTYTIGCRDYDGEGEPLETFTETVDVLSADMHRVWFTLHADSEDRVVTFVDVAADASSVTIGAACEAEMDRTVDEISAAGGPV